MAYSGDLNNCIFDGLKGENQQLLDRVSKLEIALEQANKDHVKDKVRLNKQIKCEKDRVLLYKSLFEGVSELLDDARAAICEKDNEKSEVDGSACKDCGAPLFCMMNNSGEAVPRPSTYTPQECFDCMFPCSVGAEPRGNDGSACEDCGAPLDVVMNRYGRNTHQECFECGWGA